MVENVVKSRDTVDRLDLRYLCIFELKYLSIGLEDIGAFYNILLIDLNVLI